MATKKKKTKATPTVRGSAPEGGLAGEVSKLLEELQKLFAEAGDPEAGMILACRTPNAAGDYGVSTFGVGASYHLLALGAIAQQESQNLVTRTIGMEALVEAVAPSSKHN